MASLDPTTIERLLRMQKDEISSYHTYLKLAEATKDSHNRRTLSDIAENEMHHYRTWKHYTRQDVEPDHLKMTFYYWLSRLLGLTFGIKLMEKGEERAQEGYATLSGVIPEISRVIEDEERHERELTDMLDEESLKYAGSVVLGLNDALVELTGALAGFTLAFQNARIIALAGLITGISASFSMAASEYLSTKSEEGEKHPLKSAVYTGLAYIFTVLFLTFPYMILSNYFICLAWTILNAILVIAVFNYYISVAKDLPFRARFVEMTAISLGVALFSFGIGIVIRQVFGIEV